MSIVRRFSGVQFAVICGQDWNAKNRYTKALDRYTKNGRVQIHGLVNKFYNFVSASDVYLGKAGGVTLSEVISANRPIGILGPVHGIEQENVAALEAVGLGVDLRSIEQLEVWLENVLSETVGQLRFKPIMQGYARPRSSAAVCEHILEALPGT